MNKQQIVNIYREKLVESAHIVHIAGVDAAGNPLCSGGDAKRMTFVRSAAKPLQAVAVVEAGAVDQYHFTPEELVLICSSHNGEAYHVELAASMLRKLGLTEDALKCGAHDPFYQPAAQALRAAGQTPGPLHNNCSGKHSGMLALALAIGADPASYPQPDNPVQKRMLATIAAVSGVPAADIPLGTDGCGVPVFGLPLDRLAYAYARFGNPGNLSTTQAEALARILEAIRRHPAALAGTGRFDTRLIEATQGRIIGKLGAEGVFAVAVPGDGLGLAFKVEDGAPRALYPAVVETLRQLDLLTAGELAELAEFHKPPITNWQGTRVGRIDPALTISRRLL